MSGAASSSTMSRLQVLTQKSVNQRPTMALLSSSLDMVNSSLTVVEEERHDRLSLPEQYRRGQSDTPRFLRQYSRSYDQTSATSRRLGLIPWSAARQTSHHAAGGAACAAGAAGAAVAAVAAGAAGAAGARRRCGRPCKRMGKTRR